MNYHRGGTNTFLSKTHALLPGKNGWHPQPKRVSSFPQSWGMSKKLVFLRQISVDTTLVALVAEGIYSTITIGSDASFRSVTLPMIAVWG